MEGRFGIQSSETEVLNEKVRRELFKANVLKQKHQNPYSRNKGPVGSVGHAGSGTQNMKQVY